MRSIVAPTFALLASLACPMVAASDVVEPDRPAIAIIIDDLGHGLRIAERVIALPAPVACAVLPHTPHASPIAERARVAGKEVLLHLPLQPVSAGMRSAPGQLQLDTTRNQFLTTLVRNLASVPGLDGVNTHMGSLVTRHPGHMAWLMEELSRREGLFFVDSYTTASSVALRIARESGIPSTRRDVFIDSSADLATIRREFERLKRLASERGSAVGIGHPNRLTIGFLEDALPQLDAEGFDVVAVEAVIGLQRRRELLQDRAVSSSIGVGAGM